MGYFQCNTTTQCVQQRLNCDGQADCDDASDEWNCVNDIDAKFWDHLFRKQPYGRHDDIPIVWPNSQNLSCPCRGSELLCRFQQLSAIPINLPARDITMLVLKFCGIAQLTENAFKRLSTIPVNTL
uniref:LRRNT domain-containing protein n=1 Tax=Glossina austeni TaxID=7395 RepID=A0A1A9UUE8_GLOAU